MTWVAAFAGLKVLAGLVAGWLTPSPWELWRRKIVATAEAVKDLGNIIK